MGFNWAFKGLITIFPKNLVAFRKNNTHKFKEKQYSEISHGTPGRRRAQFANRRPQEIKADIVLIFPVVKQRDKRLNEYQCRSVTSLVALTPAVRLCYNILSTTEGK
jgi:hypothetical protein